MLAKGAWLDICYNDGLSDRELLKSVSEDN